MITHKTSERKPYALSDTNAEGYVMAYCNEQKEWVRVLAPTVRHNAERYPSWFNLTEKPNNP